MHANKHLVNSENWTKVLPNIYTVCVCVCFKYGTELNVFSVYFTSTTARNIEYCIYYLIAL